MLQYKLSTLDSEKCKSFWKFCNVNKYEQIANYHNVNFSIIYNDYDSFAYYHYVNKEICLNPLDFNKCRYGKKSSKINMKGLKTRTLWALTFYHELGHYLISKNRKYDNLLNCGYIKSDNDRYIVEKTAWKLGLKEGLKDGSFTKKDIKDCISFIKSCLSTYKKYVT